MKHKKGVAMDSVVQREKTANVILRLTPEQKREIKAFAESKNMTISGLIRWLLYQTMKEDKKG
jgi:antitoxin component of RelBE/YafQ-DinJ toxin-antitoxin module